MGLPVPIHAGVAHVRLVRGYGGMCLRMCFNVREVVVLAYALCHSLKKQSYRRRQASRNKLAMLLLSRRHGDGAPTLERSLAAALWTAR